MDIQIAKWGNSLGIRIPKAFAEAIGLEEGGIAKLMLEGNRLVLETGDDVYHAFERLGKSSGESIHDLLKGMKPYKASEISEGAPAGRERFWDDEDR